MIILISFKPFKTFLFFFLTPGFKKYYRKVLSMFQVETSQLITCRKSLSLTRTLTKKIRFRRSSVMKVSFCNNYS